MKKYLCFLLFFIALLVGCQSVNDGPVQKNNDFTIDKDITEIEIVDWQTEEHISKITDTDFIQKLINELTNADYHSTAFINLVKPDFKVIFISEAESVYELGYYREIMNLDIAGRYWDFQKDGLYGVTLKLPVNE